MQTVAIEQIAARVGFASPLTSRYHLVRRMRTTPSGYRSSFSIAASQ